MPPTVTWIIEPRDPLIARDGRPFGATPGARASSLPFPFPSTTTGALRTRAGLDSSGLFNPASIATVLGIAVRGPLLVQIDAAGEIAHWFAPAPADALLLPGPGQDDPPLRHRLVPLHVPDGRTDLDGCAPPLLPVGPAVYDAAKPSDRPPLFWRWDHFERWLLAPPPAPDAAPPDLGTRGPVEEARLHVRIGRATQTAERGALFATLGREYTAPTSGRARADRLRGLAARRLALAIVAGWDDRDQPGRRPPFAPLGGERRLVAWHRGNKPLPLCPNDLRKAIAQTGHCRLVLLTPAHFAAGWAPGQGPDELCDAAGWQRGKGPGQLRDPDATTHVTVRAVALPRAQVVSGWDFATQTPKLTRRLAPAGSVYFLDLAGSEPARAAWVDDHWMQCVSDTPADRAAGFGLAVLGTWDGAAIPREVLALTTQEVSDAPTA